MKLTQYFLETRKRSDRCHIKMKWILRVIERPICIQKQRDGRIRLWASIPEMDNRVLRVILLEDGETIHNAFFDRRYKIDLNL